MQEWVMEINTVVIPSDTNWTILLHCYWGKRIV